MKILTNGKSVPAELAKAATEGEFIDLSEFLPTKDSYELYIDAEDSKRKKTAKSIDSFDTWLTAWTVYVSIVVEKLQMSISFLFHTDSSFSLVLENIIGRPSICTI